MDGNGRWAKARGLPRTFGHRAGVNALKRTVEAAPKLGVEWLTVFGFSTENWSRPSDEVDDLMGLFSELIDREVPDLDAEGVSIRFIGRLHRIGAVAQGAAACNGWTFWHIETNKGLRLIDELRAEIRSGMAAG